MKLKKKIGIGVLSVATLLGSAAAMLSNNAYSVSASEQVEAFGSFNFYDKGNSLTTIAHGKYIWTDGENIYYSNQIYQYALDKGTGIWNEITWEGVELWDAAHVFNVGSDTYYLYGTDVYKLNKGTTTWIKEEWSGITTDSFGKNMWTDGENTYYSSGQTNYVLDFENLSFVEKTFEGQNRLYGYQIWSDGADVYYSTSSEQWKLNKETSTWIEHSWNGVEKPDAAAIWKDNETVYYSITNKHYVLDRETNTWVEIIWDGFNLIGGDGIWSDGNNYYHTKNNVTFALNYSSDKIYSQTDLDNAIAGVDITIDNQESYDRGYADGIASVDVDVNEDANNSANIVEEKENGFVSFMKWINKYIFFGLFGD